MSGEESLSSQKSAGSHCFYCTFGFLDSSIEVPMNGQIVSCFAHRKGKEEDPMTLLLDKEEEGGYLWVYVWWVVPPAASHFILQKLHCRPHASLSVEKLASREPTQRLSDTRACPQVTLWKGDLRSREPWLISAVSRRKRKRKAGLKCTMCLLCSKHCIVLRTSIIFPFFNSPPQSY